MRWIVYVLSSLKKNGLNKWELKYKMEIAEIKDQILSKLYLNK